VIGVAFISDREDRYLPGCRASFNEFVGHPFCAKTIIDDRDHRLGLAGAVNAAWDWARERDVDYLLHIEEDFVFHTPIDVWDMVEILEQNPHVAQVCLKRQADPRTPEAVAGGIIECNPDDYTDRSTNGIAWVEHKRCFSLNPCLIPRKILERGWPEGNEAQFTTEAVANGMSFAFLGTKADPPRVEHVGWERSAGWRL
jgi:glycosyltransferase involved in cell wall biosynthesis